MNLTPKERMRRALNHEPVDYLPTQVNITRAVGERLAAHFGVALADLPTRLGNHMVRVDLTYPRCQSEDGKVVYDWWGVGFDAEQEGYFVADSPLRESKDLDAFPWPDPHAPALMDDAARIVAAQTAMHFVMPNFGFCLFERAWTLRGFDTFLMDLVLDPDFAADLLDRITEIQLVLVHRFIDLGVDGGYFGDDYGAQNGLLFSPAIWRSQVKSRLARLWAPLHEAGLPVILHSDGNIADIIPDLVEIGLTALNPVQPEVLNHVWLRDTFGGKLAYYGGVSTQTVLPYATPGDVRRAVMEAVRTLAPDGTGLVIAPSHRMMSDIPLENVHALLEAFEELRAG